MSSKLSNSHFAEFLASVNRVPDRPDPQPFPWQQDLVDEVNESGRWPDLLDLPTSAGKTAVIDAAVFLMALRDDIPRRVVFVIDRRVVVQQAAVRARRLAWHLRNSDDAVVREVASRLKRLSAAIRSPDDVPLQWAELRGGIVRDESWALRPDTPAVLVSTVDQVGSRLLFRGYGVSQGMRPVHAGLLGNDVLFVLDEVHLAQPFAETLRTIGQHYRPPADAGLPDRWQVIQLSATPGSPDQEDTVLRLSDRDRDPEVAPVLARRISAEKLASKVLISGRRTVGTHAALAEAAAAAAVQAIRDGRATVVGIVVNRVSTARAVKDEYQRLAGKGADCALLTGRMRPLDRDRRLSEILDRVKTGRVRAPGDRPLVVIGTQSIEAGADFDFDMLITECASFDALRQRFGRVDRDGQLSAHDTPSRSLILAANADVQPGAADPIYGTALAKTWAWLPDESFDFAVQHPDSGLERELVPAGPSAPVLLPSHLDRWVQTSPYPDADPDVATWLHGLQERSTDVNVVWRADLSRALLELEGCQAATDLVSACRPGSGEAMPVPLNAARAWLALGDDWQRAGEIPVADVEGARVADDTSPAARHRAIRPVLRWADDGSEIAEKAADVRPGDTLIVPADYGGIDDENWSPDSETAVSDLGHQVQAEQRSRAVLRLFGPLLMDEAGVAEFPTPEAVDAEEADGSEIIAGWLDTVVGSLDSGKFSYRIMAALKADKHRDITRVRVGPGDQPGSSMFVISSKRRISMPREDGEVPGETVDTEPGTSPFSDRAIELGAHLSHVGRAAEWLARACGLPDALAEDLALAGRLHDVGKCDPRFQVMLRQGRLTDERILAKSAVPAQQRSERERFRREAGYPRGGRHELLSLALIQDDPLLAEDAHDWDLVLYLVASHHGYCRPFAPAVHDPNPADAAHVLADGRALAHSTATELTRIDSGVADRFWLLVRRYGWYGLARLESVLRLADHRASAAEQAVIEPSEEQEVVS